MRTVAKSRMTAGMIQNELAVLPKRPRCSARVCRWRLAPLRMLVDAAAEAGAPVAEAVPDAFESMSMTTRNCPTSKTSEADDNIIAMEVATATHAKGRKWLRIRK